jgi:hypothetical protein
MLFLAFISHVLGVSFEGCPSGYCEYTSLETSSFPNRTLSVEYWVHGIAAAQGIQTSHISFVTESSNTTFNILTVGVYRELRIVVNDSYVDTGINGIEDGRWKHICVTWASLSGTLSVYVDARLKFTTRLKRSTILAQKGVLIVGQLLVRILFWLVHVPRSRFFVPLYRPTLVYPPVCG